MITNLIPLQDAAAANGGGMMNIIFIVALIAIFYFFMIRPQQKRQKEARKFRDSLQEGDAVITAGGIHGKIRGIKENTVMLEIAPNVKIRIDKGMIYASAQDAKSDANAVSENNSDK